MRKWSVPTLFELDADRRFSELRARLAGVTPRALALALGELELGGLVEREVVASRPPFAVYRTTAAGRRIREAL
ncbi:MAG TPA: winged helix-turn-helix transcriptional regulator [Gaiellaceae bacterium]|nr:winged helix-turn-helix transcriptional regulator [Gaiellaceae bacterium]